MKVLVVQPYVPRYRKPLYDRLEQLLDRNGVSLVVSANAASTDAKRRGDAVWPDYAKSVVTTRFRLPVGPVFEYQNLRNEARGADLIVLPLQASLLNVFTVGAVKPFLLWGHGPRSFVSKQNPIDAWIESRLLRRARGFLAYTQRGADDAVKLGVAADRVTVLRNTVDADALRDAIGSVADGDVELLRQQWGIAGPVLVFLGALDESKRVPEVLEVANRLHELVPDLTLLICGDGPLRADVTTFCGSRSWAHYLGYADTAQKSVLARVGTIMINPGRVGLNAVDSLVMGLPIVTTNWPFHAPEFDYLTADTCLTTADSKPALEAGILSLLNDQARLDAMSDACIKESMRFSIDDMAQTFASAVLKEMFSDRNVHR